MTADLKDGGNAGPGQTTPSTHTTPLDDSADDEIRGDELEESKI